MCGGLTELRRILVISAICTCVNTTIGVLQSVLGSATEWCISSWQGDELRQLSEVG